MHPLRCPLLICLSAFFPSCLHVYLAVIYVLTVNMRTWRQTARRSTFGEVAELFSGLARMTMVSQETDWIWAQDTLGRLFFPGRGVKSRLQRWGCVYPAPRAMAKKYGALSIARTHTHSFFLILYVFLSLSLYLQLSSQERNSLFWGVSAHAAVLFDTTQEQTKSICWDLNLLIPLSNCENNHLKMTLRKVFCTYFHFSAARLNYKKWVFACFGRILCCMCPERAASNYRRVILLFNWQQGISCKPWPGWAPCDPPQGLYLISLVAPVWLA